jgi:HAE1 family hydrophobic/amphiphilic exporter-1
MDIVGFSLKRPITVSMAAIAGVVFGLISLDRLPLDLLPELNYPTVTIRTLYSGAAPLEVEQLITIPIEDAVSVIRRVKEIRSLSKAGVSEVIMEFTWGTDMNLSSLEIREKLDRITLPDEADKPLLLRYDPSLDPVMRLAASGEADLFRLRRVCEDWVRRELEAVEGTAAVKVSGGYEEELHVLLNESRLSSLDLNVDRVAQRLLQENINLSGGRLQDGRQRYLVRTLNEFQKPEEISLIEVGRVGEAAILLKDVGVVERGYTERDVITHMAGHECVQIDIYKEAEKNTVAFSKKVREAVDRINVELERRRESFNLSLLSDQARFIELSIDEVKGAAFYGGLFALLVLFLFLGDLRSTLIIGVSIPVSIIATFFAMNFAGVSFNIMSLGGLALGIGMLVDSSIVVLESITRFREEGETPYQAALKGTREVASAVTASTVTTICVFLPVIFVIGIAGQLFRDQALTVTFSMLISLVVSLSLIPVLSSVTAGMKRETVTVGGKEPLHVSLPGLLLRPVVFLVAIVGKILDFVSFVISGSLGRLVEKVRAGYPPLLGWVLSNRLIVVLLSIAALLLGGFFTGRLGKELLPPLTSGEFVVNAEFVPGTPVERVAERMLELERRILEMEGVEKVFSTAGLTGGEQTGGEELRENAGRISVVLREGFVGGLEEEIKERARELCDDEPALDYEIFDPVLFSFRAPVEVTVSGYDLKELRRAQNTVALIMEGVEGLHEIRGSSRGGSPELNIVFDRRKLAFMGTTIAEAAEEIKRKIHGVVATAFKKKEKTIDVRVKVREEDTRDISKVKELVVLRKEGKDIKLGSIADVTLEEGPSEIRRKGGERVITVAANVSGRDLGSVVEELKGKLRGGALSPGLIWFLGGQGSEIGESFRSLLFAALLAVFLVYIVMASQFESLIQPLIILFSVPFGIVGAIVALYLLKINLNVISLIGVVVLSGIVVNNAIVLIDYINRLRERGYELLEAVKRAGSLRLRPILMTTATTVLALLPMAVGRGEGAELRRAIGVTVIGGLLFSTLLTLLLIPVVYSFVGSFSKRGGGDEAVKR